MVDSRAALPVPVGEIVEQLACAPGVVAVVLGGSRAQGIADAQSDWDLGVYYRGALDVAPIERLGSVHPPGSWGRVMNGGAWLERGGAKIDVLFRDLSFVEVCIARAREGDYDVDGLLGYVAGVPTYSLMAEVAIGRVLRGGLGDLETSAGFPERLAERAPPRWRFHRDFSLRHARAMARRGDLVPALGQVARAVIEEAHARLCTERRWWLNEKRLVAQAGLAWAHDRVVAAPRGTGDVEAWIDEIERGLRASP